MEIRDIIPYVFDVYKRYNIKSFPIDCLYILRAAGYHIKEYSELTPAKRAACIKLSKDACTIEDTVYYEGHNCIERIRFSLMHEFGHIVLNTEEEWIADRFAGTILAPPQIIITSGCKTANAIHDMFGLSFAAANRALYNTNHWLATTKRTEIDFQLRDWFRPPEPSQTEIKKRKNKVVKPPARKPEPDATYTPSKEFEEHRAKVLAKIRRQRRKIQKQLKQYEEDMEFLGLSNYDRFSIAEQQWIFGNDL